MCLSPRTLLALAGRLIPLPFERLRSIRLMCSSSRLAFQCSRNEFYVCTVACLRVRLQAQGRIICTKFPRGTNTPVIWNPWISPSGMTFTLCSLHFGPRWKSRSSNPELDELSSRDAEHFMVDWVLFYYWQYCYSSWLTPWAGKMKRILCCDWLPAVFRKKNSSKVIQ